MLLVTPTIITPVITLTTLLAVAIPHTAITITTHTPATIHTTATLHTTTTTATAPAPTMITIAMTMTILPQDPLPLDPPAPLLPALVLPILEDKHSSAVLSVVLASFSA